MKVKKNPEQAIALLLHITRALQSDVLVQSLRDDDTKKAFAGILRSIASHLSEEKETSRRRSFKKTKRKFGGVDRPRRVRREDER